MQLLSKIFARMLRISLLIAVVTCASFAQLRIGYVNSDTILKNLPEAQEAQDKLAAIGKQWQDELDKMSKSLQAQYEDYQKKQAMYTDATRQSEQQKLLDEQQKVQKYNEDKFGAKGEFAMQRDKLMTPIRDKILKAIEKVAKEEKLSFVFDKAGDAVVLYADASYDITYKVLDRMKRGGK
ncbi:MAG: OmpH family outer membrane protein [Bacteroidota bacterium]|nr:OmpH family outer membrane protein [Bacteroidota bacterium]